MVQAGGLNHRPLVRISWTRSGISVAREIEAFRAGLRDFGYVKEQEHHHRLRVGGRYTKTAELAARLVRSKVDIILAPASTQVEPARQATKPFRLYLPNTPIRSASGTSRIIARPGGNIAGVSMVLTEMSVEGTRNPGRDGAECEADRRSVEPNDADSSAYFNGFAICRAYGWC